MKKNQAYSVELMSGRTMFLHILKVGVFSYYVETTEGSKQTFYRWGIIRSVLRTVEEFRKDQEKIMLQNSKIKNAQKAEQQGEKPHRGNKA
jgi:hypothetical protein